MASTFQRAISDAAKGTDSPCWRVLQPPTGSGKTRGACLYAAMQADANKDDHEHHSPVGVLIVTRLIDQADEMAREINDHARRVVAVSHHSEKPATTEELHSSDVLVITHQAYVNASERLNRNQTTQWDRFISWRGGKRLLTIIDEALANVIENNKITVSNLAQVLGYIPLVVRAALPEQVRALEALHRVLVSHAEHQSTSEDHPARLLWDDTSAAVTQVTDMSALRAAMKPLRYDVLVLGEDNDPRRAKIALRVDATLQEAQAIMEQWAYYAQKGQEHSLNSSSFLIPECVPGPVVLDATAHANFLWDLLEEKAQIVLTPPRTRDYSNVTLHVARATGLGKHSMIKNIRTRFPRVLSALEKEIGPERSVFMCMHKDTEHVAKTYEHPFARFDVGHWGAIDGRNDWSTYHTAVILGLSYRDYVWSTNQFFALQGPQDDAWMQEPSWKGYSDVRQVMEQRQLSVSIIQAINRVRCRRVIDAQGRSPSADIFIILPKDKTGDAILRDIHADMPELKEVPWAFELDGTKVRKARKGTSHCALITLMSNRLPGSTAMPNIQRELGLGTSKLKELKAVLRDASHPTTAALRDIGVEYVVRGAGRGAKSYLIKDQAA
jgi:hypothetical protein